MKDIIGADGSVLSHSKGNFLISPMNKQTEETEGGNEEDNKDQDSLTDRKQSQEMNKNFRGEGEK